LAAGLRPDPLGELKRAPDPLRGPNSKGRERKDGNGTEKGKEGEWRGRKGLVPPHDLFCTTPLSANCQLYMHI